MTGVMLSRPMLKLMLVAGSLHGSSPPAHSPSSSSWQMNTVPQPSGNLVRSPLPDPSHPGSQDSFLGFSCFLTPGLGTHRVDRNKWGSRGWQICANPSPATCCWIISGKRRDLPELSFLL